MSIKRIFVVITAIFAVFAAYADNTSVTSKKYVDDFMTGYQDKVQGLGANKLMIYDTSDDGIGTKDIATLLGSNTSDTSVPTVGAVKDGLDDKQDTITGTAGYVMTGTGTPGEVGERAIYSANTNYSDSLVTAETVNSGVINAVNNSLIRVDENGDQDDNGTLWMIQENLIALAVPFPLPPEYTELSYVTNAANSAINTGFLTTTDDVEFELRVKPSLGSWYIFQSRQQTSIYGISGSSTGNTILFGWAGNQSLIQSAITRDTTHTYYIKATAKNGTATLYVKDETTNTEDTKSASYTFVEPGSNLYLWGNAQPQYVSVGNSIYSAKLKIGGQLVMDYVPAVDSGNNVGFWDKVSGTFKTATSGSLTAGPAVGN